MSKKFTEDSIENGRAFVVNKVSSIQPRLEQKAAYEELSQDNHSEWPEPQPLTSQTKAEAYPVDALPDTIQAAVEEVHAFVKAPISLVISSALGTVSLAVQAYVDIERAKKLTSPVSLYLLTIADSGERKTTCDNFFSKALRDYEQEQAEAMKPEIERYQADHDSWIAERDGLLAAIKDASKRNKPSNKLKADLHELQYKEPEPPRIPKILLSDETPENLTWRLSNQWPSAGIISSEAGAVFGSHGMSKDSIMRNLSHYNVLWDGGVITIGRRTSESFAVQGARLTNMLQVQEATLREFNDKNGSLARGMGYFARFLIAYPESTQGTRLFAEAPEHWPQLEKFNKRISEILSIPVPINADGFLEPLVLKFSPEAKALWVDFHDSIEIRLSSGREFHEVRDVASKSADNAARLAALFHVFTYGIGGSIGADCFERASRIVLWYLMESGRFFDELDLPVELVNARKLDEWLIEYARNNGTDSVSRRYARQYAPLRNNETLIKALSHLEELDRVRLIQEGRSNTILINPALLLGDEQ